MEFVNVSACIKLVQINCCFCFSAEAVSIVVFVVVFIVAFVVVPWVAFLVAIKGLPDQFLCNFGFGFLPCFQGSRFAPLAL